MLINEQLHVANLIYALLKINVKFINNIINIYQNLDINIKTIHIHETKPPTKTKTEFGQIKYTTR